MQDLLNFFAAAVMAIFIENTIFTRALGTSRMLAVAKSPKMTFAFGISITIVTTVSGSLAWLCNLYIKTLSFRYYIEPLVNVVILTVVYLIFCILCLLIFPKFYKRMKHVLTLAVFNCATLGALLLPAHNSVTLTESRLSTWVGFSFGTGIAFLIATILVSEGMRKLEASNVPKAFKGLPATLIYIGILSLAFYGLIGHELPF